MADAAPGDTSSTPTAAASAPAAAPASATPTPPVAPAAPAAASPDTTPASATPTPAKTDSTPATDAPKADTAVKTESKPVIAPEFTLPTDLTLAPEAVEKFKGFLASKTPVDGKITLTAQELVDVYADQARTASQRWQAQLTQQDKTWEAESKQRYSPAQLAAAETGVGFLSSFDPAWRELSKSFRNHPVFVNAMRIVGERLSEDEFLTSNTPPAPARKAAKDILYPKRDTH
jgi:hypothetical protein